MTRFIDRIRAFGAQPATVHTISGRDQSPPDEDALIDELMAVFPGWSRDAARVHLYRFGVPDPSIGVRARPGMFADVPIFAADNVADYTALVLDVDHGDDLLSHISSIAPPYDRFWVDVNRPLEMKNWHPVRAWGVLFRVLADNPAPTDVDPRWVIGADLYVEVIKNKPVGPIWQVLLRLAEDGTVLQLPDGHPDWFARFPTDASTEPSLYEPPASPSLDMEPEAFTQVSQVMNILLAPALLTVSLLHCTNVSTEVVEPPERLSRRFARRHSAPLTRYAVLDVKPMRQILENAGGTDGPGLIKALHTARGHFKTFSDDAPLFGRFSGTWWWAPQVRGTASSGQVLKDYRVHPPGAFGAPWRDESETQPTTPTISEIDDPDKVGRGTVVHAQTVNALARAISAAGHEPVRAASGEPDFDLGYVDSDGIPWVIEVKSLTDENEERQLRLGLGQVLRYRQRLTAVGHEGIRPVLATSRPATDPSWASGCELDGVVLVNPTDWQDRLSLIPSS